MSRTPIEIKPVSFRPPTQARRSKTSRMRRWSIALLLGAFLVLLGTSAWFVFAARQVAIRIDPQPDRLAIHGGIIAPKIGDYYLLQPGGYVLEAAKNCFQPLRQNFEVAGGKKQAFRFMMVKQPGKLSINAYQVNLPSLKLSGALVLIDEKQRGQTPVSGLEVQPGRREIRVQAQNFQELRREIEVVGCGEVQQFDLALIPAWAEISIQSEPDKATVLVDGQPAGATPLTLKLLEGEHDLELQAERYKSWQSRLAVVANQPQKLPIIRLQPADGKLAVLTKPAGANVIIGKQFAGRTPLKLALAANAPHRVQLSKPGYEKAQRTVKLQSGESKSLNIKLKPQMGLINLVVQPADANLFVDGRARGRIPPQLRLLAVEHLLEIKKQGYRAYQTRITPRPGFPQEVKVSLTKLSSAPVAPSEIIRAKNGYGLKLIQPGTFTMGSSRREQGRRSNETLRQIKLQRPFYMGIREVTNKEVRQFLTEHDSGSFKRQDLNRDQLPATGISWRQAALFCNWLSVKEALQPVYVPKGGKLIPAEPVANGYRLPTEAEWEYCARFTPTGTALKYPWGRRYPPSAKAGNFADVSAKDLLSNVLTVYNDGYAVSAPPAQFNINILGLYDMGGNVAEWCHDYYSIYPYSTQKVYVDPMGPASGRHHVIKGSSWRQAGISELRLAYRDYSDSDSERPDLGFRICRYVK